MSRAAYNVCSGVMVFSLSLSLSLFSFCYPSGSGSGSGSGSILQCKQQLSCFEQSNRRHQIQLICRRLETATWWGDRQTAYRVALCDKQHRLAGLMAVTHTIMLDVIRSFTREASRDWGICLSWCKTQLHTKGRRFYRASRQNSRVQFDWSI